MASQRRQQIKDAMTAMERVATFEKPNCIDRAAYQKLQHLLQAEENKVFADARKTIEHKLLSEGFTEWSTGPYGPPLGTPLEENPGLEVNDVISPKRLLEQQQQEQVDDDYERSDGPNGPLQRQITPGGADV